MTSETRDNLLRVVEKRIRRSGITGNAKERSDACAAKHAIWDEWAKAANNKLTDEVSGKEMKNGN